MLARREIALVRADQAHDQEQRADDDVEAVEARRHEERRAIVQAFERERGVRIFIRLDRAEQHAEDDRQPQALEHAVAVADAEQAPRSEEHTSELQSLMRTSYAVFCLKKKKT